MILCIQNNTTKHAEYGVCKMFTTIYDIERGNMLYKQYS